MQEQIESNRQKKQSLPVILPFSMCSETILGRSNYHLVG